MAKVIEFYIPNSFRKPQIEDAKRPETREKRIAAMMEALRKNQRKK